MAIMDKHAILEKSPTLMLVFSLLVVSVGGLVESWMFEFWRKLA